MQHLTCGFYWFLAAICTFHASFFLLTSFSTLSLHRETLNSIMTMGHSRVPVYAGSPTNIIGLILVILRSICKITVLWSFYIYNWCTSMACLSYLSVVSSHGNFHISFYLFSSFSHPWIKRAEGQRYVARLIKESWTSEKSKQNLLPILCSSLSVSWCNMRQAFLGKKIFSSYLLLHELNTQEGLEYKVISLSIGCCRNCSRFIFIICIVCWRK